LRKAVHDWSATDKTAIDLLSETGGVHCGSDRGMLAVLRVWVRERRGRGSLALPVTVGRRGFTRFAAQLERGAAEAQ